MIEHLDVSEIEAIVDLAHIAQSLNTPLMLVGANARRLSFDIPFKFASPRTTRDWDFAAPMENWQAFTRFYGHAVHGAGAHFRPGEQAHRIVHVTTALLVDLIPFGGLSDAQGRIHWPQTRQVMSVLGFDEAFASSIKETLPNGAEIGIVTPALLAALKIIAFSERGIQLSRDLKDLWFIMERYAHPAPHENRVFQELAPLLPDETCYEHLDSLLLGWDIGRQCRLATLAAIEPILEELSGEDSWHLETLLPRTGDLEEQQSERHRIAGEFRWLQKGIDLAKKAGRTS